jgi:hypothetical protein
MSVIPLVSHLLKLHFNKVSSLYKIVQASFFIIDFELSKKIGMTPKTYENGLSDCERI